MKKQEQKTIKPNSFTEMVQNSKVKKIEAPDSGAKKDGSIVKSANGQVITSAAQNMLSGGKIIDPTKGFLGVNSENISPNLGINNEMLYKGKNK